MHAEVKAVLVRAREARRADDTDAILDTLRQAMERARALGDEAGFQVAGWRLAKAQHDFGTPQDLLDALDPLLQLDAPFRHHPGATAAAQPIARRVWDHLGYADHRILTLWAAYSEHHRQAGDPWLASQGDLQAAWHLACRGALPQLVKLHEHYQTLSPARFGRGPTKHPDAEDTTLSLFWVQADLARVVLRAAMWARNHAVADDARELLLDALATSGRTAEKEPWVVDVLCRAADRFDRVQAPWRPWKRTLARWHREHPAQGALGDGVLLRREGRTEQALAAFERASDQALSLHAGFEWAVDALDEAQRLDPDPARAERLSELRHRSGVGLG